MRRSVARIRGLGFILWQARHFAYHIMVGLVWAWVLREYWNEFNTRWIISAIVGSVIPDLDHLIYFFTYGRRDWYTKQIRAFLRDHEWRTLSKFMAKGHKYNTSLATHNYYFMILLALLAVGSLLYDWKGGVIFFGAMVLHYVVDVADDILLLGKINPNWRRAWKPKSTKGINTTAAS